MHKLEEKRAQEKKNWRTERSNASKLFIFLQLVNDDKNSNWEQRSSVVDRRSHPPNEIPISMPGQAECVLVKNNTHGQAETNRRTKTLGVQFDEMNGKKCARAAE